MRSIPLGPPAPPPAPAFEWQVEPRTGAWSGTEWQVQLAYLQAGKPVTTWLLTPQQALALHEALRDAGLEAAGIVRANAREARLQRRLSAAWAGGSRLLGGGS